QLEDGTKPCVESVYNNTPIEDFELIIVDNDSNDGTVEYLKSIENKYQNTKIILNESNKGYAGGNNDGMKIAKGDFIVLLNNDTVVTEGWLDNLLNPFFVDEKIGIVGPISNYAGTEQKIKLDNYEYDEIIKKGVEYSKRHKDAVFDSPKLSFFCVAIKREVFEKVGFLDENFGIGMFEDDDYSLRVKKSGFRVTVNEGCFIYHKGSLSFSKLKNEKYMDIFNKNKDIFYKKHNIKWTFSDVALSYFKKIKREIQDIDNNISIEGALLRMDDFETLLKHLKNVELESEGNQKDKKFFDLNLFKLKTIGFVRKYPRLKKIIFFIRDIFFIEIPVYLKEKRKPSKNIYDYFYFLKKIKVSVFDEDFSLSDINVKFSLITTIRNEEDNIEIFLEKINSQTLKPAEVIIVDGGSTDSSISKIKNYIKDTRADNIKLIEAGNVNIAEGRNAALKKCSFEYIVVTDAGSEMDIEFCKNLVGCFYRDKEIDLVGGISFAKYDIPQDWLIPRWENVDWKNFLPSSRALAIKKSLALKMGGYPEYLTKTGEDTLFDINYRNISRKWAFNKKAIVYWRNPRTLENSNKLAFSYGYGDGESGVGDFIYSKYLSEYEIFRKLPELQPYRSFFLGYLKGRENRLNVLRKNGIKGEKKININKFIVNRKNLRKIRKMASESLKEKKVLKLCIGEIKPSFARVIKKEFLDNFIVIDVQKNKK
ncbi:MAG: glycosyltransferase family 2 protein, partial [Candidatus Moranbacteria bacterium]|nr:glycosyltransferase family 2 protein [Candidatus Moranbacteria bacterium]